MRGTRYGDFSRLDAELVKDYRAVLLQQGRVQLDADSNIEVELAQHELQTSLHDLLGDGWAPSSDAGFEIAPVAPRAFTGDCCLVLAQDEDAAALTPRAAERHTIELWLTWEGGPGTVLDAVHGDGTPACYRLAIEADGMLVLTLAGDPPTVLRASAPLTVGLATHVAIVFAERSVALLADARQLARAPGDWRAGVSASALVLGSAIAPGTGPGFRGLVGGVRVWDVERSPAQLAADAGDPPDPAGGRAAPPAWWRSDRPDETALTDTVGATAPLAWWRLDRPDETALTDVVGGHTALVQGKREPASRLVDLRIGAGRYYVGGVRCERRTRSAYSRQAGAAEAQLPTKGRHLVYLEAWEETVLAAEDRELLEVALGGLDTAVRTRIATRVRIAELDDDTLSPPDPPASGRLAARHRGALAPGNRLYRVEVHASGHLPANPARERELAIIEIDFERWELVLAEVWPGSRSGPFEILVSARTESSERSLHRHTVAAVHDDDQGSRLRLATDPASLSDRRALRVSSGASAPTFKWSRTNGADLFAIVRTHGRARTAEVLPARWLTPLAAGDVVEPLGAHAPADGPAPALLRVVRGPDEAGSVELERALPEGTTLLRRWDHTPQAEAQGAIAGSGRWTELEDGISVQAEPGAYRRGDYWWIPARADLGSIEWPHDGGNPRALPPAGVERRTARLALLTLGHRTVEVEDLRTLGRTTAVEVDDLRTLGRAAAGVRTEELPPGEQGDSAEESSARAADSDSTNAARRTAHERGLATAAPGHAPQPVPTVESAQPAVGENPDPGAARARPPWRLLSKVDQPATGLEALASTAAGIVLATSRELLTLHPQSGAWEQLAELPEPRQGFSLQTLAGELLILGGRVHNDLADGRVMAVNASGRGWRECARLPGPRAGVAIAVVDGVVHALGGHATGFLHGHRASHHTYDAKRDRWRRASPRLPARVAHATAVALDGRLHLLGGVARDGATARGVNQTLARDGHAWRSEPDVPGPRRVLDACAHGGHIVVLVEDRDGTRPPSTLTFDPTTAMWRALAPLPETLERPMLVEHQGRVLLAGATASGVSLYETTLLAPVSEQPVPAGQPAS
jgi:Family of unknown function (DUF6519)/Concanavalin A-like lectin/glucanases superfamily